MDGRIDRRTNGPSFRDARTHLKRENQRIKEAHYLRETVSDKLACEKLSCHQCRLYAVPAGFNSMQCRRRPTFKAKESWTKCKQKLFLHASLVNCSKKNKAGYTAIQSRTVGQAQWCKKRSQFNKAGYTATPDECGWAGAIFEVTWSFWQEQWGQRPQKTKKSKVGWTDGRTDKAECRVA